VLPFEWMAGGDEEAVIVVFFARNTSSELDPSRLNIPPPIVLVALVLRSSLACWNDLITGGLGLTDSGVGSGSSSIRGRFDDPWLLTSAGWGGVSASSTISIGTRRL
jgi:hypothetical protein